MATRKQEQRRRERLKRTLEWVLREWDCRSLEQAKEEAKKDKILHMKLRECGVVFDKS